MSLALRTLVALVWCLMAATATAAERANRPVPWSMAPDRVPWETMTLAADAHRAVGRAFPDIAAERASLQEALDNGALSPRDRAAAMIGLGDLFRDEARLVLQSDAADPWRIPLRTTPAWLQLEFAVRWYDQALQTFEGADPDGRVALLRAVTLSRLDHHEKAFKTYVRVIRSYRGTAYVEMAKLAVGDHHLRAGDVSRARTAYRLVKSQRDQELAAYASYRLADCAARLGDQQRAVSNLVELLESDSASPMVQVLQEASRSALANHLAWSQPLPQILTWLGGICPPDDSACRRDTRSAAADSYELTSQWRAAAWLRTVDRQEPLKGRSELRLELAAIALHDVPAHEAIERVEAACAAKDDACRGTLVHALADYFEELGRPETSWLRDYERLPKIAGRPDLNQELGRLARTWSEPKLALEGLIVLCAAPGCDADMRRVLRHVYNMSWRKRDAVWLTLHERPPELPGLPQAKQIMERVVRERLNARDALDLLEPLCDGAECLTTVHAGLMAYYDATGQGPQGHLLAALRAAQTLPLPDELRGPFLEVTRRGLPPQAALLTVMEGCVSGGTVCFQLVRAALDVFYTSARERAPATYMHGLAPLADLALPPGTFDAFLHVALDDLGAHEAMRRIDPACAGDLGCTLAAHDALMGWFTSRDRFADVRIVRNQESVPGLAGYPAVRRAFIRVVAEDPLPTAALRAVVKACPEGDALCPRSAVTALAEWYQQRGRPDDANRVRTTAPMLMGE